MRSVKKINVKNKKVLVRCDFNVTLNDRNEVIDDFRIRQALPTIRYLIKKKAKVILISHFKEPSIVKKIGEKGSVGFDGSLFPITSKLAELLKKKIHFVDDCIGEKAKKKIEKMKEGDVILLENVRIYKEEKEASFEFAKELSLLGDVFINESFSVSHRNHASVAMVPQFLKSGMGFLFEKEYNTLQKVMNNPRRPLVAIVGGAKIETKISALQYFLENANHLLLGGKIANMVLIVRKIATNLEDPGENIINIVKNINYTSSKLHLPVDVVVSKDATGNLGVREMGPGKVSKGEDIFDIGEETISLFGDIVATAKTIIWSGPLGLSEVKSFENGTKKVAELVAENKNATKIIGGGDTLKAFKQFGVVDKIDFASSGGGAMLQFLRGGDMPGVEALKNNRVK